MQWVMGRMFSSVKIEIEKRKQFTSCFVLDSSTPAALRSRESRLHTYHNENAEIGLLSFFMSGDTHFTWSSGSFIDLQLNIYNRCPGGATAMANYVKKAFQRLSIWFSRGCPDRTRKKILQTSRTNVKRYIIWSIIHIIALGVSFELTKRGTLHFPFWQSRWAGPEYPM